MTEEEKERGLGYLFFSSLSVVGWIQLVLQVVFPISLQMEMLNLPKLARTRLIPRPSSHSMSTVVPSHPYFVRRSDPEHVYVNLTSSARGAFAGFGLFFAVEYLLASCQKMLFANMPETGRVNIPR